MKPAERNENRWFWDAVETKPERGSLDVQGANINFFTWSREGPGFFFCMVTTLTRDGGIL